MSLLHVASILTIVSSTLSSLAALSLYVNPPLDMQLKKIEDTITGTEKLLDQLTVPVRRKIIQRAPDFFEKLSQTLEIMQITMNFLKERSIDATFAERYLWSGLKAQARQAEVTVNTIYKNLLKTTNTVRLPPGTSSNFMGTTPRGFVEWQRMVERFSEPIAAHRNFLANDPIRDLKVSYVHLSHTRVRHSPEPPRADSVDDFESQGDVEDDPMQDTTMTS